MNISVDMQSGIVTVNRCGHIVKLDLTSSEGLAAFHLAVRQIETIGVFAPALTKPRELIPA